ncbi:MAG TPA: hypothetical protein PKC39_13060 [Ferruginibacter sp.]|nr:hypothetical protein [Ferruginibacter sp.]HMP21882.1 hypothetical protein [Ferruginibacter sp.]
MLRFILSHAFWAAVCAAALVIETTLLAGLPLQPALPVFVFFATCCSYNFHFAIAKIYTLPPAQLTAATLPASNILCIIIAFLGMVLCYPYAGTGITHIAVAALCTLLYSLPLLPLQKIVFIRRAGFIKTLLLAFTWTYVTAYLPMVAAAVEINIPAVLLLLQRFVFMLLLCIIFDQRDVHTDAVKGFHSLATDLTARATQRLLYILFAVLALIHIALFYFALGTSQSAALMLALAATLIVYRMSVQRQRGFVFYYFLVDGLMLLSAVLTIMASI